MMFKKAQLFRRQVWVSLILLCTGSYVFGGDLKTLHGHVPQVVSSLSPLESLPATNQLRLAIGLPLHNTAALAAFMDQLYDPASPGFRQFLTPEEFTDQFGPTAQDYEAVKNFARSNGLAVAAEFTNRLLLDVTGPASAVEKAFHIQLHLYRHPTEARNFYAPDAEPAVDVELPVLDIQGLSDYSRPRPRFTQKTAPHLEAKNGSAPDNSGQLFGNDFRNAYVPGTTLTGAGQSVALFEADGYYTKDILSYATAAGNGRTNISIQTVLVDSFSGTPTSGRNSGNPEVSLDIELAMAVAPGLTSIIVVEGNPNNYIPNDILNSMLSYSKTAKNLSCSWGWSEGPSSSTDDIFTNMAAVGQTFFNASGDSCAFTSGSSSVNGVDNPSIPNAPSSCPIITQVGGTTMTMNGTGASYASEVVWNWGTEYGSKYNGVGSSGGVSSYYAIPSWQATVPNLIAAGGSTGYRNIPDVAANADNVYITYHNGRSEDGIGGTSCAAPIWAGFLALVNQQAAINGKPAIGFINPALYALAAGANYSSCFHDVTSGNNTWSNSPSLFYAQTGYDLCTGLGTPGGVSLINALAGTAPPTLVVAPVSGAAAGYAGGPFVITSQSFQLTNTPSASLSWSLVNTSSWLAFSATNGTLSPGASTTVSASLTAAATNLTVGNYTDNLIFSNLTAGTSQSAAFTLQVNQPLVISPAQIATSNANFNLSLSAVSGLTYQLQYITNLAQTNWINLSSPQLAGANLLSFSDTNALNSSPARYYRIIISP